MIGAFVVAADVQRPLGQVVAQAAQHIGLEQMHHHRIQADREPRAPATPAAAPAPA
jgi:hypothetical protein